jgi:hypothetical protein
MSDLSAIALAAEEVCLAALREIFRVDSCPFAVFIRVHSRL